MESTTVKRKLDSLTQNEAADCFRLAFLQEPIGGLYFRPHLGVLELYDMKYRLKIVFGMRTSSTIASMRDEEGQERPAQARIYAVYRYLESLGIPIE